MAQAPKPWILPQVRVPRRTIVNDSMTVEVADYMDMDEPTETSAVDFDPMDIDEPTKATVIAVEPIDNDGLTEMDTNCEIHSRNNPFDCSPLSINCKDNKGCLPSKQSCGPHHLQIIGRKEHC